MQNYEKINLDELLTDLTKVFEKYKVKPNDVQLTKESSYLKIWLYVK